MSTVHNNAKVGEIAKNVLIAGDPLRAKYIAEKFLKNVKLVSEVRNMLVYTGKYKNRKITVMGSGIGMSSMTLYAHELYSHYNVENIIRIGSCGAIDPRLQLFDTIVVGSAITDSNIGKLLGIKSTVLCSSENLMENAVKKALELPFRCVTGRIYSSELFYNPDTTLYKKLLKIGVLGVEMESYALYAQARIHKKNAITMLAVSNIIATEVETTPEEREKCLDNTITLALNTIWNL